MCWIHGPQADWQPGECVPLAVLDAPCPLRDAAIDTLDSAGLPWRIAFSSASLAGVWAAISAGLGIGLRTPLCLPAGLRVLPLSAGLPALGTIRLCLYQGSTQAPVAHLAGLIRQAVDDRLSVTALPSPT